MRIDGIYTAEQTEQKNQTQSSKSVFLQEGAVRDITETYTKQAASTVSPFDATYEKADMEDIMQEASAQQETSPTEKMQYAANTMTAEDGTQMQKDGFSLENDNVETIVTETDKIKVALAKAGVDTSYFGDDVSLEEIEQITGSASAAMQVASAFEEAGLPATEQNVKDTIEALETASSFRDIDDGAVKYMLDNELAPTVENIYKAEHSGSVAEPQTNRTIDFEELQEPISQTVEQSGRTDIEQATADAKWLIANDVPLTKENLQMVAELRNLEMPLLADNVLKAAVTAVAEGGRPKDAFVIEGYSLAERAASAAEVIAQATPEQIGYLTEQGQEVTVENLQMLQDQIKAGTVDLTAWSQKQAENAVVQNNAANNAENVITQNNAAVQNSVAQENQTAQQAATELPTIEQYEAVKAQRQLEEIRLAMTVEANFALLKQGISIETQPLEALVEQLKSVEDSYYQKLLSQNGVEATPENIAAFRETTHAVEALKAMPEYLLGSGAVTEKTLSENYTEGEALSRALQKAGDSYETLMTAPRADMGDSIRKAFRNIDAILENLQKEVTPENERAVRILAYNSMEITPENIERVKAADAKVQVCFEQMTPKTVLEMIRQGENPLNMTIDELNETAQQIRTEQTGAEEEKYSEFLWKLEQAGEISEEERSAYVGIYRLLGQIDKTDGAAIGALLQQGVELNMSNLLSAVRTMRHGGMDVSVDDTFGELEDVVSKDLSISEQIEKGYQTDCARQAYHEASPELLEHTVTEQTWQQMTPEQLLHEMRQQQSDEELEQSYQKEQLQQFAKCAEAEESIMQTLERYDMPKTMYHILAATSLRTNRNQVFRQLFESGNTSEDPDLAAVQQEILERFGEAMATPEEMAKAQEELAEAAEHAFDQCINAEDASSLDIRTMRQVGAAVALMGKMAEEENYSVPVLVGDEMTNVSLKIVRGKEEKGKVDIIFSTDVLKEVAAELHASADGVQGIIAVKDADTAKFLQQQADVIAELLGENGQPAQIDIVESKGLDIQQFYDRADANGAESAGDEEEYQVQTTQLYGMAKRFLNVLKQLRK